MAVSTVVVSTALQVLVAPLVQSIYDNTYPPFQGCIGRILGVHRDMAKLQHLLLAIQEVIEGAEDKQIRSQLIRNWLRDLKDVSYKLEDLLDEFATDAFNPKSAGFFTKYCAAKKIHKLIKKFEWAVEQGVTLMANFGSATGEVFTVVDLNRETSQCMIKPYNCGRSDDEEEVLRLLRENLGTRHPSCCAIVGMNGVGKSTLAKMVFHSRYGEGYSIRCWVHVSKNFELKTILQQIVSSLKGNTDGFQTLSSLICSVEELLRGKKLLLVLDDVWNEDQHKWESLKSILTCSSEDSSIIVTTCLETVADLMRTLPLYRLAPLSDEDCYSLFKYRAFAEGEEKNYPNLEEIGKVIVQKCAGIPMAAKAMGGLLRFKREEEQWSFVRDSNIWELPQDAEDSIFPTMKLSYSYLPVHLKQCFAFCSMFPKGCRLEREELIQLWTANGFVRPRNGMELEETGNEIFNALLWRSFFQDAEKDEDGNITWCKMHYLVHDLASSIMLHECSAVEVLDRGIYAFKRNLRHLFLDFIDPSSQRRQNSFQPNFPSLLRTLFYRVEDLQYRIVPNKTIFSKLNCLRALKLSRTDMKIVPDSICKLKHLRYLDLSYTAITSLPESICRVTNLQTLKLRGCASLISLPREIRKLSNLSCLDIYDCDLLSVMPKGLGKLIHLQKLSTFAIGPKDSGYGGIDELEELNHLRGELRITAISHVSSGVDAGKANLIRKRNLRTLTLSWLTSESEQPIQINEELNVVISESLQPHVNIRRLFVECYPGVKFPGWMGNSFHLPNLVKLTLKGDTRCEYLPSLGQLPLLQFLEMSSLNSLSCLGNEFYGDHQGKDFIFFPSLEELRILDMHWLEKWLSPIDIGFTRLTSLSIISCPKLASYSRLPSSPLSYLEIRGCCALKNLSKGYQDSLQTLVLENCDRLELLPNDFRHLTSLKKLKVRLLPELTDLPVVGIPNYAPGQDLIAAGKLEELLLEGCRDLKFWPRWILSHRDSLHTLTIRDCKNLQLLPDELSVLITDLQTCEISECNRDLVDQVVILRKEDEHEKVDDAAQVEIMTERAEISEPSEATVRETGEVSESENEMDEPTEATTTEIREIGELSAYDNDIGEPGEATMTDTRETGELGNPENEIGERSETTMREIREDIGEQSASQTEIVELREAAVIPTWSS